MYIKTNRKLFEGRIKGCKEMDGPCTLLRCQYMIGEYILLCGLCYGILDLINLLKLEFIEKKERRRRRKEISNTSHGKVLIKWEIYRCMTWPWKTHNTNGHLLTTAKVSCRVWKLQPQSPLSTCIQIYMYTHHNHQTTF